MAKVFDGAPVGAFHICEDHGDDQNRLIGLFLDRASALTQAPVCALHSDKTVNVFDQSGEVIATHAPGGKVERSTEAPVIGKAKKKARR
jgi:hypothetical protein